MRFTFLLPCDGFNGGTRVVAVYAAELQKRGHAVLVVTGAQAPQPWHQRLRSAVASHQAPRGHIALSGVPHKTLAQPGPIGERDVPDADFVIATWWETAVWMHAFGPSKGHKVHLLQGYEVWYGQCILPQLHAALRLPNTKIASSSGLAQTIEDELDGLQMHVVPNAVDLQQFQAPVRNRQHPPRVGFIYSTASVKGADICITACEMARQRLGHLHVLAFGTGPVSAALPLPAHTEYIEQPAQDTLRSHYAACDFWLFASRLDSFGLPILEAMACRTPVISVPIGAAPELIAKGGGMLVGKDSPQAMADAIVALCQAPDTDWTRMSDAAHATAHAYSWTDATHKLLQVLQVE